MNILYAKSILYIYPNLLEIADQIDLRVLKRAYGSRTDYSSAESQCEKIINLTEQKEAVLYLYRVVSEILTKFTPDEMLLLDYKYFHKKPKEFYVDFDYTSRSYFRKQIRVCNKMCKLLEKEKIDDNYYQKAYLSIDFFSELLRRVIKHEEDSHKNKSKKNEIKSTIVLQDKKKMMA